MTEQANPCLPECQPNQAVRQERFHAPACPNAPKASEAPGYAAPVSVLGHADKVRNEYLALRARLAEVEAENEEMSVDYNTLKAERDALRAEVLDLKRKIEVLESDRGKGCNPSRDPDHNDR